MSLELVEKSLDLVTAGEGLPSTSATSEEERRRAKRLRKRRKGEAAGPLDADFAQPAQLFLKKRSRKAAVRSRLEEFQSRPQRDELARNVARIRRADAKARPKPSGKKRDDLAQIINLRSVEDRSRARALQRARELQEAGQDWLRPKPKRRKAKEEKSLVLDNADRLFKAFDVAAADFLADL